MDVLRNRRVPLDNNACEKGIRPVAIGRNNWLFAGSVDGGRAAATIYTLVESAKASGVDPCAYLGTRSRGGKVPWEAREGWFWLAWRRDAPSEWNITPHRVLRPGGDRQSIGQGCLRESAAQK